MCEPTTIALASFGLSAIQMQQQYQADKDRAAAQELKNKEARKSAQRAYLSDLSNLDRIKAKELKKKAAEKEGKERDLIIKQDEALLESLEKGNANVDALLRDVGFDYQPDFDLMDREVSDINIDHLFGRDDAYAAMRRSFNKVPDVFQPSKAGLLIGTASAGLGTYADLQSGRYGKGSTSDLDTGEIS